MEYVRKGPEVAEVACCNGRRVLFSYGQPVALYLPEGSGRVPGSAGAELFLRVDAFVSKTTERHITEFLAGARVARVGELELRQLVRECC